MYCFFTTFLNLFCSCGWSVCAGGGGGVKLRECILNKKWKNWVVFFDKVKDDDSFFREGGAEFGVWSNIVSFFSNLLPKRLF